MNPQHAINFSHLRGIINDWVTVCEIPFEKVEAETFKDMLSYVYPQYKQVGRRTVRDDIVNVLTPQRKDSMKKFLQSCITTENTGFSFITDIYTSIIKIKAYMAVTIHFIVRAHDWQLYHTLLGFEQIDSPEHCGTRWNSTLDMISSALPYAEIIDTMTDLEFEELTVNPETMALIAAKVTLPSFGETYQSGFWYQLEQLRNFLSPLKETTVTLSARKTPTYSSSRRRRNAHS